MLAYTHILYTFRYQSVDKHNINYSDIRKKIQHCSDELNDTLKMVNEITSTSKYKGKYSKLIYFTY